MDIARPFRGISVWRPSEGWITEGGGILPHQVAVLRNPSTKSSFTMDITWFSVREARPSLECLREHDPWVRQEVIVEPIHLVESLDVVCGDVQQLTHKKRLLATL